MCVKMRGTLGGNHLIVIHFLINGRQSHLLASSLGLSINVTFVVVKIISPSGPYSRDNAKNS